jgi:hypothetical protein
MTQRTAKTVDEALRWIHTNAHHDMGLHWAKGLSKETGFFELGQETHMYYKNYIEKLLVPLAMWREFARYIVANPRPFDTRAYALTKAGKRRIATKVASANV